MTLLEILRRVQETEGDNVWLEDGTNTYSIHNLIEMLEEGALWAYDRKIWCTFHESQLECWYDGNNIGTFDFDGHQNTPIYRVVTGLLVKLFRYAKEGKLSEIKRLAEGGTNIHAFNDAALWNAVNSGHFEVVEYLVEHGANVNAWSSDILCRAAKNGHFKIVQYLVEHGADIHVCDSAALWYAINNEHLEIVKYLIAQSADATGSSKDNIEIIKYLTEQLAKQLKGGDTNE